MLGRKTRQLFEVIKSDLYALLVDGDQVSALTRLTARRQEDGRVISYRLAHFSRFRDGKMVENLSLLDEGSLFLIPLENLEKAGVLLRETFGHILP